uniref:Uncharacterized protein n=1 Tax=Oryza glumipatula TaxID=40148 RepID=A0A0D9ZVK3_9ORYZ
METLMAAELPQQKAGGGLARRLVRLLRRKRSTAGSVAGGGEYDESSMDSSINSLSKLKLSAAKLDVLFRSAAQPAASPAVDAAAAHALVASLFAGVSAVKAAYAQLQQAQHPYDAEAIQSADAAMERAHPGRTLAALDGLHLSGLNATHFLTALRHAARSVCSFAKSMLGEMRRAGWDPVAAAAAAHPGVPLRHPGDAKFALESFVALKMFDGFHRRDFGLSALHDRSSYDRRRLFDEFAELKATPAAEFLDARSSRWGALGEFLRDRYLSVVHERMEEAFFGSTAQRGAAASAGAALPGTPWFAEFAEMARRVWLLHCLFLAFDDGGASTIFQVAAGARFSEVYMESVGDGDGDDGGAGTAVAAAAAGDRVVGFTVVPGFKVGRTVMQCRVYLSRPARQP